MGGTEIQYLLGIYFIVIAITWVNGRIDADAVKLIAGVLLVVTAALGYTLVS